jgi:hypothetical protein
MPLPLNKTLVGPQGPVGPQGQPGPQGPLGPQGNQGPAGNAQPFIDYSGVMPNTWITGVHLYLSGWCNITGVGSIYAGGIYTSCLYGNLAGLAGDNIQIGGSIRVDTDFATPLIQVTFLAPVGFYSVAPVPQQTGGFGPSPFDNTQATLTSTEKDALNAIYNALVAYGLLPT